MKLFQDIEDKYNTALESNDTNKISKLLADDWTLLEPSFGLITKESFINSIEIKDLIHSKMKKNVENVKIYGNIAIVLTKGKNIGKYKNENFDAEVWITNVYQMHQENWIMINSHECPVTCK